MQSHQKKKKILKKVDRNIMIRKKNERHEKENEGQRRKSSQRFNTDLRRT